MRSAIKTQCHTCYSDLEEITEKYRIEELIQRTRRDFDEKHCFLFTFSQIHRRCEIQISISFFKKKKEKKGIDLYPCTNTPTSMYT